MIWKQDRMSLVVTDSGLGGLDIAARLVQAAVRQRCCQRLDLTFVNCMPATGLGYNHLPSDAARAHVFSQALTAMTKRFRPDALVIACNTLSAVYPWTDFSRQAPVPVVTIIEPAARMVSQFLHRQPDAAAALFATPVTCQAQLHRQALLEQGICERRLLFQPCPALAGAIDQNSHGSATAARIDEAVLALAQRLGDHATRPPVAAAMFCTHYGYVTDLFRKAFARHGVALAAVLNPNQQLVADLLAKPLPHPAPPAPPTIQVQVVSQCGHSDQVKQSIGRLIELISPQTARALRHDVCEPMFPLPDIP